MKNKIIDSLKAILPIILIIVFIAAAMMKGPEDDKAQGAVEEYPMTADAFLLDTFCSITIYEGGGKNALLQAEKKLLEYDNLLNPSKEGSDIYKINNRTEAVVEISQKTMQMLEKIMPIDNSSNGDLNTAIKPLTQLWDFKDKQEIPDETLIQDAISKISLDSWGISEKNGRYYFEAYDENVMIDAGSYAKGFIADEIKTVLKECGVTSAIINLGGNIQCIGKRPDGNPFIIGLREPKKGSEKYLKKLDIDNESVVTAGIYERYFEKDGIHYHHILDPYTGYPVQNELAAVTVVGPDSMYCDALSTTLFIKGKTEGEKFLQDFNTELGNGEYKAFFIEKNNNISYSEGADKLVHN
ncbi:MAG: FAD:protein FMN transferase [Eubacteriales bacterium]|nr:FAD:protein FMN transferase [Eubacteriales bacterium]